MTTPRDEAIAELLKSAVAGLLVRGACASGARAFLAAGFEQEASLGELSVVSRFGNVALRDEQVLVDPAQGTRLRLRTELQVHTQVKFAGRYQHRLSVLGPTSTTLSGASQDQPLVSIVLHHAAAFPQAVAAAMLSQVLLNHWEAILSDMSPQADTLFPAQAQNLLTQYCAKVQP